MMMMRRMKKKGMMSPTSMAIGAIGIGAAIWLGKAWGRNMDEF